MRPSAYYELTDGCQLTFADVVCEYYFGPPPELEGGETYEQTQAYHVGQGENSTMILSREARGEEEEAEEARKEEDTEGNAVRNSCLLNQSLVLLQTTVEGRSFCHSREEQRLTVNPQWRII